MAVTLPLGTVNDTSRRTGFPASYAKLTWSNTMSRSKTAGRAFGASTSAAGWSRIPNTRSALVTAMAQEAGNCEMDLIGDMILSAATRNPMVAPAPRVTPVIDGLAAAQMMRISSRPPNTSLTGLVIDE